MIALALTVLIASLLGSLHCAGMCGGFVAFYSGAPGAGRATAHAAYNAGRLIAYALLGAAAGALGAVLDLAVALAGVQRGAAALAGALIVVWGAAALLESLGIRVGRLEPPALLSGLVSRGVRAVAERSAPERGLVIGLLTGCLPCGWLWAFLVTAAGTGSALAGAGLMIAFWLGTLPVMIGLGAGIQAASGPLRRHVPALCALAMIVVGLFAVAGRIRVADFAVTATGQHEAGGSHASSRGHH